MVDEDIQNAYDEVESKFGSLDIVVHNAGINNVKDEGFRNWRGQLGVNLGGIFEGTRVAKGKLRANGVGGVIINIASITGKAINPFNAKFININAITVKDINTYKCLLEINNFFETKIELILTYF